MKLFGFRSNKIWKKFIAVIYLIMWALLFVVIMTEGKNMDCSIKDFFLNKISNFIIFFFFASPFLFFSQTKFREKLPLLNKHKLWANVIFYIVFFIIAVFINTSILELHSKEYLDNKQVIEENTPKIQEETPSTNSEENAENSANISDEEIENESSSIVDGSSRSNPIIVTTSQFVNEINSNIDNAKERYNGKWIQITGEVNSVHNVAGMTSFYLYGEKGGSGLKIVSWVNKEELKPFDYKGETHTFLGQVREVSTVNSTEIGNCEIVE